MKLARPDVFHPRIVLAGCRELPDGDGDDAGLAAALGRHGLHAHWLPWDDPATLRADLVILRATRDYPDRLDEFLPWTRRVRNLLNPPKTVAWNADQRYLVDLDDAGVPTVRSDGAATSLVFVGGEQSHAFTAKGAAEPDFEVWDVGYAALAAARRRLGMTAVELLYARVDVIDGRVRGINLIDPSLGWTHLDADARDRQQRAFVVAVESALERLGLGPLSHRRP